MIQRKPRPMPWRMCRTCHRAGTATHGACPRQSHPLEGIGACGQCGKRRPLVTCHAYDFRRRSSLSRSSSTASALTRKKKLLAAREPKGRKPRKASETERIYGSPARRAWVKAQPCAWCSRIMANEEDVPSGNSHNAHTTTGGTGRKADASTIVPLCPRDHRKFDLHQPPFDQHHVRWHVKEMAPEYEAAWQTHCAASTPSRSTTA